MLDLVPGDILRAIIDQIPHCQDRNSLSQASKKLYAIVSPTLYETVIIKSLDESNLAQTDIQKFLRTSNRDYFTYIKQIWFLAPIETNDQFRCIHNKIFHDADGDAITNRDEELVLKVNNLGDMMSQIRPLLQELPDGHLKGFHWHIGTCIPKDILGPGGYLPTKQSGIENLSLITSDPCILPKEDWEYHISLTEFKCLKEFSWSGGLSREYFNALRDMLSLRSKQLEMLKIDLIDWWDAQWNWCANDYELQIWIRDHNFFGEKVIGLDRGETCVMFPSLKSLSFSSINFGSRSFEMAHAFNISNIHSLNLRDCPQSGSLLRAVVESGKPINLRSLELVIRHNKDGSYRKEADEDCFEPFLTSFEGLVSLKLLVLSTGFTNITHRYWPSIYHHKKTLVRLVYHERSYDGWWLDCNTDLENDKVMQLFMETDLESLGMCLSPIIPAEASFSQLTVAHLGRLKLLCLRTTGPESEFEHHVVDSVDGIKSTYLFARWAFKTFTNLLFIALGDFSYGRQYASTQEILYRYPFPGIHGTEISELQNLSLQDETIFDGFRQLREEDRVLSSHLDQFRDVLEACPEQPLYRKDF